MISPSPPFGSPHREQFPPLTPAELEPRAIFESDGQWSQDAEPRPPLPGASAEFHKIRLSAPVRERAWFGTVWASAITHMYKWGLSQAVRSRTVDRYLGVPHGGDDMGEATTDPVLLPPGPRIPKAVMGIAFLTARHRAVASIGRRYGSAFTVNLPIFGETVVISDPALIKDLFTTSSDLVARASNLGTVLGPGSTFSLDGDEHRARRKLLVPPFHGKRMVGYEAIVEEEVMREIESWPEGREFETLQPMMRITLNAILRTVFGAQGDRIRPTAGAVSADDSAGIANGGDAGGLSARPWPMEPVGAGAAVPQALQRDHRRAHRRSAHRPGFRDTRRRARPYAAGALRGRLADLRRPRRRRTAHAAVGRPRDDGDDAGVGDRAAAKASAACCPGSPARSMRAGRSCFRPRSGKSSAPAPSWRRRSGSTRERIRLGEWVVPKNHAIIASITMSHSSEQNFADPTTFNPDRFLGANPDTHTWIPYRRRHPAVHRRLLRQHGDERHAANVAARIRVRHNVCRRRAHSLARRGHCTSTRRARRCVPTKGGIEINDSQRSRAGVGMTIQAGHRRRRPRHRAVLRADR